MHYGSTRYQLTVSLTAMVIKNAALSHLKGIWVTDILINKVPISQHQVCSLHNFSLLEWMEIRCPLPQWFPDSCQEKPYMKNDDVSHFKSKESRGRNCRKEAEGSQSTWVTKNGHQTLEFIKICKPGNEWMGSFTRLNWEQSLSQKSGKDHRVVNYSRSQTETFLKSFFQHQHLCSVCHTDEARNISPFSYLKFKEVKNGKN